MILIEKIAASERPLYGAMSNYLAANYTDGIIGGSLNACAITHTGNTVIIDTGIIVVQGYRVIIDSPYSYSITSPPASDQRMQIILRVTVAADEKLNAPAIEGRPFRDILCHDPILQNGVGTYEIELCRFTASPAGVKDLQRIVNIIPRSLTTGNVGKVVFDNVTADTLPVGAEAEASVEQYYDDEEKAAHVSMRFGMPIGEGPPGPPPAVQIGKVETVEPGGTARVWLDEASVPIKPILNFALPAGRQGEKGEGVAMGMKRVPVRLADWQADEAHGHKLVITPDQHGMGATNALMVEANPYKGQIDNTVFTSFDSAEKSPEGVVTIYARRPWEGFVACAGGVAEGCDIEARQGLQAHKNDTATHVSAEERTAWNAKETPSAAQAKADAAQTAAKAYADQIVAQTVNGSPELLDTLRELAAAINDDPNFAATVAAEIGKKVDKTAFDTHTADKANPHGVTAEQAGALPVAGGSLTGALQVADVSEITDPTLITQLIRPIDGGTHVFDLPETGQKKYMPLLYFHTVARAVGYGLTNTIGHMRGHEPQEAAMYIGTGWDNKQEKFFLFYQDGRFEAPIISEAGSRVYSPNNPPAAEDIQRGIFNALRIPADYLQAGNNITLSRDAQTGRVTITASFGTVAPYNRTVQSSEWTSNPNGGYQFTIAASAHGKGTDPQVETYNADRRQTYDSPAVDAAGNVTLYSRVQTTLHVKIR